MSQSNIVTFPLRSRLEPEPLGGIYGLPVTFNIQAPYYRRLVRAADLWNVPVSTVLERLVEKGLGHG